MHVAVSEVRLESAVSSTLPPYCQLLTWVCQKQLRAPRPSENAELFRVHDVLGRATPHPRSLAFDSSFRCVPSWQKTA